MKTLGEILQLGASFLQERKVDRPRRSAEELMAQVLGMKRIDLYLSFDKPIEERELVLLRELLKRRSKGEPIEYILGEVEFLNCKICIDRRVLIPRPETEILADLVVKRVKSSVRQGKQLWDLCTGSGCLGIALKKALPELSVTLSDLSEEALEVAGQNARLNGVDVELVRGDLLAPFKGRKADFVIANPPYISKGEWEELDPSVRDFEPSLALIGGERGVEFYERLAYELPSFLNPQAQIFLEIGASQGEAVKQIFSTQSWEEKELFTDWARHPRFFCLKSKYFL